MPAPMHARINQTEFAVTSADAVRVAFEQSGHEPFRDICLTDPNGPILSALLNGPIGWLMYLHEPGDAGFSSRNPSFSGGARDVIEYRLSNGQADDYPASWALPGADILAALMYFVETGSQPPFIAWHDDRG
jgi:Immunity protein Imm1